MKIVHEDEIELLENQSLIAELFANSGSEPYFEGLQTSILSTHAKSTLKEEDNALKSDDEMHTYNR